MKSKPSYIGDDLDTFLKEEGIYEEVCRRAAKKLLALRFAEQMKRQRITKSALAKKMKTSRSSLDRVLSPTNASVSLDTLERAAAALGRRLKVELV
ncbi:MAG TPA: helix-turn-helix transcriptional regulator [Planctomycetota bacterium]|nr:helix-turn-helix transcriptional regulator [Planctomycetota bacterium]